MLDVRKEQELAAAFAEIARILLAEPDVQSTLEKMCELLVSAVDGCDHAALTMVGPQGLESPAASDEVGLSVNLVQLEVGEGPCLEALSEHVTSQADDLTTDGRWPRFSRRVAQSPGVRSVLAYRLFLDEETLGSLNLYSKHPSAFSDDAVAIGTIFAAHAAVALRAAQTQEELDQLRKAVQTRDLIARANGILVARKGISPDSASEMLCRAADRLKIKLGELALRVVEDERGRDHA